MNVTNIVDLVFQSVKQIMDIIWGVVSFELYGISPFKVALISFVLYCIFRFIIDPLLGGSVYFGTDLAFRGLSDNVKISKQNNSKNDIKTIKPNYYSDKFGPKNKY